MKKLKRIGAFLLMLVMCITTIPKVSAADGKVKPIELKNQKNIKKYDVTGDGKVDKIRIDCDNEEKAYPGWGTSWKIYINDKVVYQNKDNWTTCLEVQYYKVSAKRIYLLVTNCMMENGDILGCELYQYKNGTLKKVCDFYDAIIKNIYCFHYGVSIKSMTAKKIVISCRNQFNATAYLYWDMEYQYKSGKWKKTGTVHTVTNDINKIMNQSDTWTANRKFSTTTTAGGKKKAFTVKKGDKVKIKKICLKNKHTYIHITNAKGKTGWLKDPKTSNNGFGCFKEAMFAG